MTTHPCTDVSVVVRDMVHEERPTRAHTVTIACRTVPSRSSIRKHASEPWQHKPSHTRQAVLSRTPSLLPVTPASSHAASRSAAPCVACSYAALPRHPRRTHLSPSVQVLMPRPWNMPSMKSPSYLPPPRNIKPQKTPAQAPANPRQSPPRLNTLACPHTRMPSHNPRLAPTPTCPLPSAAQARKHAPPPHTTPHAELSPRHAPLPRPRPHAGSCSAAAC
jgi:hypothetical protein